MLGGKITPGPNAIILHQGNQSGHFPGSFRMSNFLSGLPVQPSVSLLFEEQVGWGLNVQIKHLQTQLGTDF